MTPCPHPPDTPPTLPRLLLLHRLYLHLYWEADWRGEIEGGTAVRFNRMRPSENPKGLMKKEVQLKVIASKIKRRPMMRADES